MSIADAVKKAEKMAAERKAVEKPRKMPALNEYLVAYIDILGFGQQIEQASTAKELATVYKKVQAVQAVLQHPAAVDDELETAETNTAYGKRVLALSDAVVIAVTTDCEMLPHSSAFDILLSEVCQWMLTQADCAIKGIFLRGGISHGTFFYEDDILLSPALVRAYRLERDCAKYPVIVLDQETHRWLAKQPGRSHYSKDADPFPNYFLPFGRSSSGEKLHMLDYLGVMLNEDFGWGSEQDRQEYLAAHDPKTKQTLLNRKAINGTMGFLRSHGNRIVDAYRSASSPRVREKYRWLFGYHNRTCKTLIAPLKKCAIPASAMKRRAKQAGL